MKLPAPKTLFVRLVLVLVAGLLAAQLLAGWVLYQERIRTLYHASGLQSAQRISEIVDLLERHGADEREQIIRVLNSSRLHIALDARPWVEPAANDEALSGLFNSILRRSLGNDRPMQVTVTPAAALPEAFPQQQGPGGGRGQGAGMGWRRRMAETGLAPGSGLYFLARIQLQDGVWVSFDHRVPEQTADWPWRLSLTVAILLLAVVAIAAGTVRWLTRPLSTLADAAEQLGRDLGSPPVPEGGPLEVKRAAAAFNTMQNRLRLFIEDRTRILAAVSHDLRTPLTRLRLHAESLEDPELKGKLLRNLDEMRAMTDATLDFLRGMETRETTRAVDIQSLLETLVEDARELGHSILLDGDPVGPCPARPLALKRCLDNLIENALRYGREVRIQAREFPDRLEIAVTDKGPGIPEDKLDQVFEPFYRIEHSRNRDTGGTGLGLSIARNIARTHGGDLILRNGPEKGLEAVLTLPR